MTGRTIEQLGKLTAACALLTAVAGAVLAPAASAAVTTIFYVGKVNATDISNTCTDPSLPCATVSHALAEQALLNPAAVGNLVEVAKGTYSDVAVTPNADNDNVTITGVSPKKTVIDVTGSPAALVDVSATTGVTLSKLSVRGTATGEGVLGSAMSGTTNTLFDVDVRAAAPIGVDADGAGTGASTVLTKVGLTPSDSAAKAKSSASAGWSAPQNLRLNRIPALRRGLQPGLHRRHRLRRRHVGFAQDHRAHERRRCRHTARGQRHLRYLDPGLHGAGRRLHRRRELCDQRLDHRR